MADALATKLANLSLDARLPIQEAWAVVSGQYRRARQKPHTPDQVLERTNNWLMFMQMTFKTDIDSADGDESLKWLRKLLFQAGNVTTLKLLKDKEKLGAMFLKAASWNEYVSGPIFEDDDELKSVLRIASPEDRLRRLQLAFEKKYVGNVANDLAASLRNHYEPDYNSGRHFGKSIPIVQSNGTGKSKAVYELSTKELLLSVCFRDSNLLNEGWPPRDQPVAAFLGRHHDKEYKPEELAAAFYGGLLHSISACAALDATVTSDFMGSWALANHGGSRDVNFQNAMTYASDTLKAEHDWLMSVRVTAKHSQDWHIKLFEHFALGPQLELAGKVAAWYRSNRPSEEPFFLIAFDECASLSKGSMTLLGLQRIIKAADYVRKNQLNVKFWHLLLDTTYSIFDIPLPSGPQAASYHLRADYIAPSIWPYMSFDIMTRTLPPKTSAATSLSIEHLSQFGRPLWATSIEQGLPVPAVTKLFRIADVKDFNAGNEHHVFAAFSHRVLLELASDSQASTRLTILSVQQHMRLLMDVVDNNLVVTKCPSEPILSVAAALALTEKQNGYRKAIDTLIDKLIVEGTVRDVGTLGELCSRILLTMARDFATCFPGGKTTLGGPVRQFVSEKTIQAITLRELLQAMLGPSFGILSQTGPLKKTLDKTLKWANTVYINFTHIIDVHPVLVELEQDWLEELWFRTSAVQCALNQPFMDGFIVGYAGNLDKPFERSNLVVIPWQTKNRRKALTGGTAQTLVSPHILNQEGNRYKPTDHLVIFMDLMTTTHFQDTAFSHVSLTYSQAEPTYSKAGKPTWDGFTADPTKEAKRYVVNIRGYSPSIYPVVDETKFDVLFRRLGTRVTTNEHYRERWDSETSYINDGHPRHHI